VARDGSIMPGRRRGGHYLGGSGLAVGSGPAVARSATVTGGGVDLTTMRVPYGRGRLDESGLAADPLTQFAAWLAEVAEGRLREPNAAILATADDLGRPSSRHVLVKVVDERGFVVYTNLRSRKAAELVANPWASLCFPWSELERQVVVCGRAEPLARDEVEAYWRTRPRVSQLGAWASARQSAVLPGGRQQLEQALAEAERRFPDEVPVPPFWGGFRVLPDTVEFWQGGAGRLHDRLRYRRVPPAPGSSGWVLERLSP
jgi:pyridoxamine 5'-phosphate oxidase